VSILFTKQHVKFKKKQGLYTFCFTAIKPKSTLQHRCKQYYKFGTISHENLKLKKIEEQISLVAINEIEIANQVNYYLELLAAFFFS
jgi:hypothetical protein